MKILHKYILRELLWPIAVGFGLLAFVFVLRQVYDRADDLLASGVMFTDFVRFFFLSIPPVAPYLFPAAYLFALLLCFGRLSRDGEILAMRAAGIALRQLVAPLIVVSVLLSGVTFFLADIGTPWAMREAKLLLLEMALRRPETLLPVGRWVDHFKDIRVRIGSKDDDGTLHDIEVVQLEDGEDSVWLSAKRGEFVADEQEMEMMLRLHDCEMHRYRERTKTQFEVAEAPLEQAILGNLLDAQERLEEKNRRPKEMGLRELFGRARDPSLSARRLNDLRNEYGERLSLPFACIVLTLIAAPLGAKALRSGRSYGVSVACLIILCYYALMLAGQTWVELTTVTPVLANWLPNLAVGGVGLWLLKRADSK
jgi:lipopolysaccharide export system permease protein